MMHMDIAVFKSIAYDRMEKIKDETYGKRVINRSNGTMDWKMSISMLLNAFI
ncbi:hypothetical protein CV093_03560 [Oceanobacillus sp. 143]|uniref:hypothetical protein n=1 Tax=Oceanobacillus zhaokaii TaxID=2052660 RepID=UPI0013193275|nr:hypothetical protein [Oceanobacillus zhaokaii]QGS68062.1 hypothetical protein CV093_03560 [Oceanobacillus sp. 143]